MNLLGYTKIPPPKKPPQPPTRHTRTRTPLRYESSHEFRCRPANVNNETDAGSQDGTSNASAQGQRRFDRIKVDRKDNAKYQAKNNTNAQ